MAGKRLCKSCRVGLVPVGKTGKKEKCPNCGNIYPVPVKKEV